MPSTHHYYKHVDHFKNMIIFCPIIDDIKHFPRFLYLSYRKIKVNVGLIPNWEFHNRFNSSKIIGLLSEVVFNVPVINNRTMEGASSKVVWKRRSVWVHPHPPPPTQNPIAQNSLLVFPQFGRNRYTCVCEICIETLRSPHQSPIQSNSDGVPFIERFLLV